MINYHQDDSPQRWFAWISGGESLQPLFIPIVGASSSPLLFGSNNELSLNFWFVLLLFSVSISTSTSTPTSRLTSCTTLQIIITFCQFSIQAGSSIKTLARWKFTKYKNWRFELEQNYFGTLWKMLLFYWLSSQMSKPPSEQKRNNDRESSIVIWDITSSFENT